MGRHIAESVDHQCPCQKDLVNAAFAHWSLALLDAESPASPVVDWVAAENSVTRLARGFVLLRSSMAETLVPPLEDLLPFFWSRAMKFSLRELDLWLLPRVRFRRSLPLVLCFTGDVRLCRQLKESDGSLRPRTFRLDLATDQQSFIEHTEFSCMHW